MSWIPSWHEPAIVKCRVWPNFWGTGKKQTPGVDFDWHFEVEFEDYLKELPLDKRHEVFETRKLIRFANTEIKENIPDGAWWIEILNSEKVKREIALRKRWAKMNGHERMRVELRGKP